MQVYHFMPGSHATGPYHDEIPMNESVVNSIPEARPSQTRCHEMLINKIFKIICMSWKTDVKQAV